MFIYKYSSSPSSTFPPLPTASHLLPLFLPLLFLFLFFSFLPSGKPLGSKKPIWPKSRYGKEVFSKVGPGKAKCHLRGWSGGYPGCPPNPPRGGKGWSRSGKPVDQAGNRFRSQNCRKTSTRKRHVPTSAPGARRHRPAPVVPRQRRLVQGCEEGRGGVEPPPRHRAALKITALSKNRRFVTLQKNSKIRRFARRRSL